jgi:hypothetical protein
MGDWLFMDALLRANKARMYLSGKVVLEKPRWRPNFHPMVF